MKRKNIVILILFIFYIVVSLSLPLKSFIYGYYDDMEFSEKYYKRYGYDYTNEVNASILNAIKSRNSYDFRYIYLFGNLNANYYANEVKYYITNINDVDKLMEDEKISNEYNIDFKKPKFSLPMQDKDYAHIFEGTFTTEKQEAKVIGKDDRGYSIFDISPDALIFATVNGKIISYAYIDNRLLDTRDSMNKWVYRNDSNGTNINFNNNGTYNKYKLELVD